MGRILILLCFGFLSAAFGVENKMIHYHSAGEIKFGGKGGWDALTVDSENHRLFVSHSDRVVVMDTQTKTVVKELEGTNGVHGIALASDLNKAYSSDGQDGNVSVISLADLSIKGKVKVGENPDAIVYEPFRHQVYAFNGRDKSASVIDAKTDRVIATIPLPGKPEFAVVDPKSHRIFVNIEDKNLIGVIDSTVHRILGAFKLTGCESPSGLAMDYRNQRLFSVCENEVMVMLDMVSGKILASVSTGEGTDGADFDPEMKLAFSSNGRSGTTTIVHEEPKNKLMVVQSLQTHLSARTIALDPKTHRIYLPTADLQPGPEGGRPKPIDGTQRVLIFEP